MEGFVIVDKFFESKSEANQYISNCNDEKKLILLEVNEYPTLGYDKTINKFLVCEGFYNDDECKDILNSSSKNTSALFVSKDSSRYFRYDFNFDKNKISSTSKFNFRANLYREIYITNLLLFITFYLVETVLADILQVDGNIAPTIFTYVLTIFFVRRIYSKNPRFTNKIAKTIGLYILIRIIWAIIFMFLTSLLP